MNDKKNVVRKTKRSIYGSSTCRGIMTLLSFFALILCLYLLNSRGVPAPKGAPGIGRSLKEQR